MSHAPVIIMTHNDELEEVSHVPVVIMTQYDELVELSQAHVIIIIDNNLVSMSHAPIII